VLIISNVDYLLSFHLDRLQRRLPDPGPVPVTWTVTRRAPARRHRPAARLLDLELAPAAAAPPYSSLVYCSSSRRARGPRARAVRGVPGPGLGPGPRAGPLSDTISDPGPAPGGH